MKQANTETQPLSWQYFLMTLLIGSFEGSYGRMESGLKNLDRINKSCTMASAFAVKKNLKPNSDTNPV